MKLYTPILSAQGTFEFDVPDGLNKDQAIQWVKDNTPVPRVVFEEVKPNFDAARLTQEIHRNYEKS